MNSLSIQTKLVMLFSALVTVPMVAAIAWLGVTAHRSVLEGGRALTRVADASLQQSANDVARLTGDNADRSSAELVRIAQNSLTGFATQEVHESEQALRQSADRLTRTGSGIMQGATERIAAASSAAVNDASGRLRRHQREAVGAVSDALIHSSRRAFNRVGQDFTAQTEAMVVQLARDLNLERSHRTAELVQTFLQQQFDAVRQAAQQPPMLSPNPAVPARLLRQLVEQHRAALLQAELLDPNGDVTAQWPPPLSAPADAAGLPTVAAEALKTGRMEHSSVQFGASGTPPTMAVAVGLRTRRVLVATLSLEMLSHYLARQVLGDGRAAPVFVMTRDGQILAHSEPANVGTSLSLPRPPRLQRIDADTVMYESGGAGPNRRLTHLTEIRGTDGWVVVAVQPLGELLAKTAALRHSIATTAEAAANEMARQASARAAALEAAALTEQRRVAEETARRVRDENRDVSRQAVAALVFQQNASARRDIARVQRDSKKASQAAAVAMTRTAQSIAMHSGERIHSDAMLRARLGLASMHELASQTAVAAAGRIVIESGGVLLVALMAALLVALLTAQSAVRPITALAAGARSIAQGDFSHRVPNTSEDELGQLAASFNRMAASIEASRAELQASNAILAQEKRRIQTIVDNSPDGLLILNEDGSVGYANPAARSLLPWQETARGNGSMPLDAALPPDLLRRLADCLELIDTGRATVCDLTLDAPRRVLQVRSVALEGGERPGEVGSTQRGAGGFGRLIHLHDMTREREIDEMKSSFVMLVSHELRTPLTSILGFSSYMLMGKMGPLTEAQQGGLESIARQAHRLKAIAADFLDLSRIETGQLEIRREPVDLARVAQRVLEELSPQAQERGLWLRLSAPEGAALAIGDEGRIAQIFTNLVHNGIKFTETGGVEVAISNAANPVCVEVRDTGIGIPPEEHSRVFERFYQVEGVVTRRAGGTGLGLSIVKILVEAHGGEVGVRSAEGGTTFYFTIPAAPRPDCLPLSPEPAKMRGGP